MELKYLIFYLAIFFFFFRFNPFFPFDLLLFDYAYFIGNISGAYIAVFLIYEFILKYDKIKEVITNGQNSISVKLVEKDANQKIDFIKFSVLSIVIFLCMDIIFTKISNESIYQYFVKYIPGLNETLGLISIKPETIIPSNITNQGGSPFDPKFGSIKEGIGMFVGPMLGAVVLFALRQLSSRSKLLKENKYPGARILLIFLIISLSIMFIDIFRDPGFDVDVFLSNTRSINPIFLYSPFDSSNNADEVSNKNITTLEGGDVVNYQIEHLAAFLLKFSFSTTAIVSIISIWLFDWYLFSKLWENK